MKPAVPSEIRPVYPVRMFSAIAARENTRIGIITEESTKLDPVSGITTKARTRMTAMPIRSWRSGNTAASAS
jgi:hypothetical protein